MEYIIKSVDLRGLFSAIVMLFYFKFMHAHLHHTVIQYYFVDNVLYRENIVTVCTGAQIRKC